MKSVAIKIIIFDFYRVDTYVRINGRLNSFGNRVSVVGHSMRPVKDFNEVTYHFLDAIHTHLKFVKPDSKSSASMSFVSKRRVNAESIF